jgi:dTDP-4-amino-4,6-dideoxygalactose transaminase
MDKIRLFKVFMAPEAEKEVGKVLNSGFIGQGPKVDQFEKELASFFGTKKRIISLNSCTTALDLAYRLIGIKEGDYVISTPMTCVATNLPLYNIGVNIIWADVDPITGLIDINDIKKKFNDKVKAIICVDWCGSPCDYEELRKFGVPIVEDSAHALMTKYKDSHISNTGADYICFSFQAIKHLTCGDGGAIIVPDDKVEAAIKMRWFGFDRTKSESFRCSQDITTQGFKYHMNDISACIGLENLRYAKELVTKHIRNAKFYDENISNKKVNIIPFDVNSSYWIYTILVDDKDGFIKYMSENNIEVSPVHNRNDNYSIFSKFKIELPGMNQFFNKQLAIPVGWWIKEEEIKYIVEKINNWN